MVRAGLRFLAAVDATQMTTAEQASCLRGLEHADAAAAARTSMLGAFTAGQGYSGDGDYSPARGWCTGPRSPAAPPGTTPPGSSAARAAADEILLAATASGLELEDLAALAAEMYEKSRQDKPDTDDEEVLSVTRPWATMVGDLPPSRA